MKKLLISATAFFWGGGAVALALVGGQAAIAAEGDLLTVSHATVSPGGDFNVSGAGCDTGTGVVIAFNGLNSVATPLEDGTWSTSLTAPDAEGTYPITASCRGVDDALVFNYTDASIDVAQASTRWISIGDPTRDGCTVAIPVEGTAGGYTFNVWDDGSVIETSVWQKPTDGTDFLNWTIVNPAGDGYPGVGLELVATEVGPGYDMYDPYTYPPEVADSCAEIAQGGGSTPPEKTPSAAPKPPQAVQAASAGHPAGVGFSGAFAVAGLLGLAAAVIVRSRAASRATRS